MYVRKMWPRYLLWFAHEHVDFRHAEMQSLLSMFDIPIKYVEKPCEVKPYWVVEVPSEECIRKLASRSVLLKNCIELWSRAKTELQLHQNLKRAMLNSTDLWITSDGSETGVCDQDICPGHLIDACRPPDKSFKVEVETFCKHFNMKEKVGKIEKFDYLRFEGPVKLKNPDIVLSYIEFYGLDPNNVPEEPEDLFFGRWVADGQRDLIQQHSLKKRTFIGNTSMDPALALLAANQAQLRPGDLVLDPFVGSGSLLVAAAHFGAYVYGTDIDYLMLHGRTRPTRVGQKVRKKEESIRANMQQYGCSARFLDVVVSDSSLPLWRPGLRFDALLTDPPYGIREPTERVGIEKENYTLAEEHLEAHVPAKVEYGLGQLFRDLLHEAARLLPPGRRLVCWYPVLRSEYDASQLPAHPCLRLAANSEQVLSRLTARRLLTYERTAHPRGHAAPAAPPRSHDFREKYFNSGEETRRARKERRAAEVAAYLRQKENQNAGVT